MLWLLLFFNPRYLRYQSKIFCICVALWYREKFPFPRSCSVLTGLSQWQHKRKKMQEHFLKVFYMLQTCTFIASNWQYEFCAFYLEESVQYLHVWSPLYSRISFIQCQKPQNIRLFEGRLGRFLWAKALQMQMSEFYFWHGNFSASEKKKSLGLLLSPILETYLLEKSIITVSLAPQRC